MAAVAVLSAAAAAAALLCARPRPTRHQLVSLMAPNTKGSSFEWKDPTSIYVNGEAFAATVDVLLVRPLPPFLAPQGCPHSAHAAVAQAQLDGVGVELVAGIDAAGYVLGAALASRLRVGFLAIRKGGSLPVPTDEVRYSYSKGSGKRMEMRASAFPPVRP